MIMTIQHNNQFVLERRIWKRDGSQNQAWKFNDKILIEINQARKFQQQTIIEIAGEAEDALYVENGDAQSAQQREKNI